MIYDKPKVTIDLDEYNALLEKAKESREVVPGVTENELSETVLRLLIAKCPNQKLTITKQEIDFAEQAAGIKVVFVENLYSTLGNSTKIIFKKTKPNN